MDVIGFIIMILALVAVNACFGTQDMNKYVILIVCPCRLGEEALVVPIMAYMGLM